MRSSLYCSYFFSKWRRFTIQSYVASFKIFFLLGAFSTTRDLTENGIGELGTVNTQHHLLIPQLCIPAANLY